MFFLLCKKVFLGTPHTLCIRDLDKLIWFCGWILGLSQFLRLPQLPQKIFLIFKSAQKWSKNNQCTFFTKSILLIHRVVATLLLCQSHWAKGFCSFKSDKYEIHILKILFNMPVFLKTRITRPTFGLLKPLLITKWVAKLYMLRLYALRPSNGG